MFGQKSGVNGFNSRKSVLQSRVRDIVLQNRCKKSPFNLPRCFLRWKGGGQSVINLTFKKIMCVNVRKANKNISVLLLLYNVYTLLLTIFRFLLSRLFFFRYIVRIKA